ncbi:hypothetical protein [Parageobacillus thermoglucosidasius]
MAIANIPNYGGGIRICPDACYHDGLFDICIRTQHNKAGFVTHFSKGV